MAYINLAEILTPVADNIDALYLCTQEPANYTEATATYAVGRKLAPTVYAPDDRTPSGKQVAVAAIDDGEIIADGTATHWAVVAANVLGASVLYSAGPLAAGQLVVDGNTFTLTSFEAVGLADPT
jgi:hypothetical protein